MSLFSAPKSPSLSEVHRVFNSFAVIFSSPIFPRNKMESPVTTADKSSGDVISQMGIGLPPPVKRFVPWLLFQTNPQREAQSHAVLPINK